MENITIGEISAIIGVIVALISGFEFLIARIKKILDKQLDPIKKELNDEIVARLKTNLVNYQCLIENGAITDFQLKNYYEEFDKYTKRGYNSYIHEGHEKLKKEGKI